MPEGPSIIIAREAMLPLKGKVVHTITGYGASEVKLLAGKRMTDIKTWGKHLLLCFGKTKTIRIHFMLFGKYRVNSKAVSTSNPKLHLGFNKDEVINIYGSNIKLIEEPLDDIYDWTADVMNKRFDVKQVKAKLKEIPEALMIDALMNQQIFSGVGNIIKNEVMWRAKAHPKSIIENIPARKISEIIKDSIDYSFEFLAQRKVGTLSKNWKAYTKKICPRCNVELYNEVLGKSKRRTFYCNNCQVLY